MTESVEVGIKDLNKLFPCKEALYDLIVFKKGYYLPPVISKAVTIDYLLDVVHQKVLTVEKKKIEISEIK